MHNHNTPINTSLNKLPPLYLLTFRRTWGSQCETCRLIYVSKSHIEVFLSDQFSTTSDRFLSWISHAQYYSLSLTNATTNVELALLSHSSSRENCTRFSSTIVFISALTKFVSHPRLLYVAVAFFLWFSLSMRVQQW